jgi:hypothetical protein
MGNLRTTDLQNCQSLSQAVTMVCRKSWGAAILDENTNTLFTNKPGFFIGKKGANVKAMQHLAPGLQVRSFTEINGCENHLVENGVTFHPLVLEQLHKEGKPCFTATAGPTGNDPELFTISGNSLNWLLNGLEAETLELVNIRVFTNQ